MNDIFKDFPRICFGKRKNIPSGVVEDYLILEEFTKGFNQTERNNFEKIVKCFSWTSKSNSGVILSPCYGIFPLKENLDVLIMRFLDDGYDNQGRPDLLRVDCVKLPSSYFEDLKTEPQLFFSCPSWNMHFLKFTSIKEFDNQESNQIVKCFFEKYKTPLIIGDPNNYTFKLSDGGLRNFSTITKMDDEVSIEIKNHVLKAPTVITPPIKVVTTQSSAFSIFNLSVVLTVLVAIGVPGYLVFKSVLDEKQSVLDKKQKEFIKALEEKQTELDKVNRELTGLKGKEKTLEKDLGEAKHLLVKSEKDKTTLLQNYKDLQNQPVVDLIKITKNLPSESAVKKVLSSMENEIKNIIQDQTLKNQKKAFDDYKSSLDAEYSKFQKLIKN